MNKKDALFLTPLTINAMYVFPIPVQVIKTVILNFTVKLYETISHSYLFQKY